MEKALGKCYNLAAESCLPVFLLFYFFWRRASCLIAFVLDISWDDARQAGTWGMNASAKIWAASKVREKAHHQGRDEAVSEYAQPTLLPRVESLKGRKVEGVQHMARGLGGCDDGRAEAGPDICGH